MSKHWEKDVDAIHQRMMALFGVVEQMIDKAVRALCLQKADLAQQVIEKDMEVNQTEVAIEEECLKILALHHPVAFNLRRVATLLKINSDLERIADLACNVAERSRCLQSYPHFPIPDCLPEMASQSSDMVRMALDSFVDSNVELAKKVIQMDVAVDEANRRIIDELRTLMKSNQDLVDPALHFFSASRHLERIGDHAENIAEDVIYLVDGEIIRHRHGYIEDEEDFDHLSGSDRPLATETNPFGPELN